MVGIVVRLRSDCGQIVVSDVLKRQDGVSDVLKRQDDHNLSTIGPQADDTFFVSIIVLNFAFSKLWSDCGQIVVARLWFETSEMDF